MQGAHSGTQQQSLDLHSLCELYLRVLFMNGSGLVKQKSFSTLADCSTQGADKNQFV